MKKPIVVWEPQEGAQVKFMTCPVWECLLHGNRGGGKGLLPEEKILTPRGWTELKNLKEGSVISNPDGTSQTVIQIFNRDYQQMYGIRFADGTYIECDGDHLWYSKIANRIKGKTIRNYTPLDFYGSIFRTEHLYELMNKFPNKTPLIPCNDPIFYQQNWKYEVDSYTIGLILGDGCISGKDTRVSSIDEEIIEYLKSKGAKIYKYQEKSAYSCHFMRDSDISIQINKLGLRGTNSKTKFIPKRLMQGSIEERIALLQGLMDSDGFIGDGGRCSYSTISKKLAYQTRHLILSLGGWASISEKVTSFTYNGIKKKGQLSYTLYIQFPNKENLFRLSRKKTRAKNCDYMHGRLVRKMVSIEKLKEKKKTICIIVNNPNRLFITKGFLVTHNTDVLLMDYAQGIGRGYGADYRGLLLREATTELGDIIAKSEKWFPRMFPGAKYNSQKKIWKFPEGESLWFNYARTVSDYDQYHGHEYPWIAWEELTNQAINEIYLKLMSCNRCSNILVPKKYRSTCNPSGVGHCVPFGEVLTTNGFVDIRKLSVGDIVFSMDKYGTIIEKPISQIHSSLYNGKMNKVVKRGLHIECTPNHKLPKFSGVVGDRKRKFTLLPFKDLPGQSFILRSGDFNGSSPDKFNVPIYKTRKLRLHQPTSIDYSDYMELLGWFLSEGYSVDRDKAFGISQSKDSGRKSIVELLNRCGFHYGTSEKGFLIHSPSWWNYFRQFGKCRDKFIPKEAKNSAVSDLQILFDALMDGDGHRKSNSSGTYYTISKRLQEDFCEISLKLGYIVKTKKRRRKNREWLEYSVSFKKTSNKCSSFSTGNHRYSVSTETQNVDNQPYDYKGKVYCIGVEGTHTFILRQKGTVWISGNSWVKQRFIDSVPEGRVIREPFTFSIPDDNGVEHLETVEITRTHLFSDVLENKILLKADPLYRAKMLQMTQDDEMLRKAWIHGSWDLVIGGFFTDVWVPKVHVLPNFRIPKSWDCYRSFDWGSSKPWSVTFFVESSGEQPNDVPGVELPYFPKGTTIVIREIYGWTGKVNEGDQADSSTIVARIKALEETIQIEYGLIVQPGPADTSIYDVKDGKSIGMTMAAHPLSCHWTRAYKGPGSRVAGWALIRQMLGSALRKELESPHLYFFDQAAHHIRTIAIMQRDKKKPEDINSDLEDHCFPGDAIISTGEGKVSIKELVGKTGKALSVNGRFFNFSNCRMVAKNQKLVRVTFVDGYSERCTPDHEFLTTRGFVEAQNLLTLSDTLCIVSKPKGRGILCELLSWLRFCLKPNKNLTGQFITNVENITKTKEEDCIGMFGNSIMEKFHQHTTFTIKKAQSIIKFLTYCLCGDRTIYPCIVGEIHDPHQNCALSQQGSGIKVKRGRSGTWNTISKIKMCFMKKLRPYAQIVEPSISQQGGEKIQTPFVPIHANQRGEERKDLMILKKSVQYVPSHLRQISTEDQYAVLAHAGQNYAIGIESVQECEEMEDVYCLEVETTHTFALGNGVLVSNCMDSMRYGLTRKSIQLKLGKVGV